MTLRVALRTALDTGIVRQVRPAFHLLPLRMEPPSKRQKLAEGYDSASHVRGQRSKFLSSFSKHVSPPPERHSMSSGKVPPESVNTNGKENASGSSVDLASSTTSQHHGLDSETSTSRVIPSPIQLTQIRDLPASDNQNTIGLGDILGDPLIKEAWIFNFCFDVDWLMQFFDPDTRHLVKVKIIHGSWRREDMNKILIDDACSRMENVNAIQAYLPDAYGTHHGKMFILFRHDDTAQVIIHTANMLEKDWRNMTQAVWRSPLLPRKSSEGKPGPIGSGSRFKHDLLRYLKGYGRKLKDLADEISHYSFNEVRAALIASVPLKFKPKDDEVWGHEALGRALAGVPVSSSEPHFVFQVSSIASLPATWFADTLYRATGGSARNVSIIFPTAEDVRSSLDGYSAGGSIHTKAQKDVHLKQIATLRPQLCRWATSGTVHAKRLSAAPHIKTYVRFASVPTSECPTPQIDWALVTSANLSTHAWGSVPREPKSSKDFHDGVVHVQSYEIGVLVWPDLFVNEADGAGEQQSHSAVMLPTFSIDLPASQPRDGVLVGFRMPYDLPLTSYRNGELPWSPQSLYDTPDTRGLTWPHVGF